MRVAGQGDVLGGGAEFHRHADLVDQIAGAGADDGCAQHPVGLGIGDQLDETTLGLMHRLGAGVAHEVELADLDLAALGLQRVFGLADGGHLGRGVDDARNDAVVHVAMFARDHLGDGHAFVFGLMGQHRPLDDVADGVDALDVGGPVAVGGDLAAFGHLDPQRIKAEALRIGFAPGGNQHHIGVEGFFVAALLELVFDLALGFGGLDALDGGPHDKGEALLFQDPLEATLDVLVHAGADCVHIFDHGDLGAEAGIDRAKLKPDNAGADHHHFLGHLRQRQCAGAVHHDAAVVVDLNTRQGGGHGAGGDDDILGLMGVVADLDLARLGDRGPALEPVDLVLLHEEFNAAGVLADDLILVGFHLVPVDRRRFPLEAHGAKIVFCFVQHMGRVQQRLGGDAADVETGAAKGLAAFDDGGLEAQLGAADGADIAAGACADDDDVIGCHGSCAP
ncbi:hypothetical protein TRIHO_06760 [Tritonibacter horizontis]|uniref:NAD-specific glutamate dehydrogenase n=1 Tax=Tritonibacter horizontis TaxID=1768241 RepID=A0A132C2L5_9RHOB|nr:hypothetical protein TRIHO_06760 [Tritonibacter horizontis]